MELLSAEERSALRAPFAAASGGAVPVTPAVFPTVGQLDPERMAALSAAMHSWMETLRKELSHQLRSPCSTGLPHQQMVSRGVLPAADEEAFWGAIAGFPECRILVSLPRTFAAAICERIFGAPLQVREDRVLTSAEHSVLRGLTAAWLRELGQLCAGQEISLYDPEGGEATLSESPVSTNWIRFTSDLQCGTVSGGIRITMPPATARSLLDGPPPPGSERLARESLRPRLGEVPVELRAILGQADFALDELAGLQIGDVIALDRAAQDPVEILVDGRPFYRAQAGLAGQRIAFELIEMAPREKKHDG